MGKEALYREVTWVFRKLKLADSISVTKGKEMVSAQATPLITSNTTLVRAECTKPQVRSSGGDR
jgi:hypothetical protein